MVKKNRKNSTDTLIKIATIALLIISVVLAYAILDKNQTLIGIFKSQKNQKTTSVTPVPSPSTKIASSSSIPRRPLPPNLTQEEKRLLTPPSPTAPKEEKDAHYNLVVKLAQDAEFLSLNKCDKPSPLAMRVKFNGDMKIKNDDNNPHLVIINPEHQYTIAANETKTIKVDFGHGPGGVYGYICDNIPGVVGFFLISP